jgi:hypothetical protein
MTRSRPLPFVLALGCAANATFGRRSGRCARARRSCARRARSSAQHAQLRARAEPGAREAPGSLADALAWRRHVEAVPAGRSTPTLRRFVLARLPLGLAAARWSISQSGSRAGSGTARQELRAVGRTRRTARPRGGEAREAREVCRASARCGALAARPADLDAAGRTTCPHGRRGASDAASVWPGARCAKWRRSKRRRAPGLRASIQVESGGDACRVVVGALEHPAVLHEVHTDQEGAAGPLFNGRRRPSTRWRPPGEVAIVEPGGRWRRAAARGERGSAGRAEVRTRAGPRGPGSQAARAPSQ